MPESDLMFRSAIELAGMVRSGEVSARELVQCSLDRIEELNPTLNAFVQVDAEGALATAEEVRPGDERPFAGVPIAIKNNRSVKGLRLTHGCSLLADYVGTARRYHHTAPISMIYALREGLRIVQEEGLEARWRRHARRWRGPDAW